MTDNKIREIRIIRDSGVILNTKGAMWSGGSDMSSWRNITVGNLGEVITGYTPPTKNAEYFGDVYPFITPTDMTIDSRTVQTERFLSQKGYEYNKNRLLPQDAVCVTCIGATIGKTCMTTVPSVTNQQINSIAVDQDKYDPYFVYYLLITKTDILHSVANSATTPIVNKSTFASINICVPPLPTQTQIANFLDRKTKQIDELIRIKERRIELLQEQRTALINQAVTKGLDPNVEMKPSGVEWIGEIPAHWGVKRLKHIAKILPSNVDKHIYPDEIQVRLCNYTDVYYNDYITVDTVLNKGSCKENEFAKFALRKGDVIITKDSETPDDIGVPTYVKDDLDNVVCGYHLTMIRPIACRGEFIFRFIQSDRTRRYFEVNSNGITRYGLGKASIENLLLPIPPDSEQTQIANFLDQKTQQIDELIAAEQRKIELLKEYRQALISEAVTGKIDVRNDV
ncbi:hypothetical protein C6496_03065 [Candidatus Poribacteria bacterium]|nr:MAG: hypothetical protein C6496_03065 [Candidatus Poribacteria bacterium]